MNDEVRLERLFADGLHELAPRRAPDRLRTTIKAETGETRPRARWLALIKEPPMRTNNRVAVGSPTARVAAIMAATLLAMMMIIGAGVAGAQLLAADGPIVVDASGGGDFTTIGAAVDAADDGDEILMKPGTYGEELVIDKDITLRGDGPVDQVVIEMTPAVLITLTETDAEIANLTLRGDGYTQGMKVLGGAPVISGVIFDGTGVPYGSLDVPGDSGSLGISGGSARVLDSRFLGGGEIVIDLDADAVLEGNEFSDGPHLYLKDPGDDAVVRDNIFSGTFDRAMGLFGPSTMTIANNVIDVAGGDGITVGWNIADGADPLIEGNEISGATTGIWVVPGAAPVVSGNRIHDNGIGIKLDSRDAVLRENTICDNGTNVELAQDAIMPDTAGNTVCEDAPAE